MKSLRPISSLALAAVLGGFVVSIVAGFAKPDARTGRELLYWFGSGAVSGLIVVAPIAAGEGFRGPLRRLVGQHAFHVNWYVSLLMAIAVGYVYASIHHQVFDKLTAVSGVVVFLGAGVKLLMGAVYEWQDGDG